MYKYLYTVKRFQVVFQTFHVLDSRNGWQIISPSKSFTVYAATATEKAEWMAHINKCVQDLLKKREYRVIVFDTLTCYYTPF